MLGLIAGSDAPGHRGKPGVSENPGKSGKEKSSLTGKAEGTTGEINESCFSLEIKRLGRGGRVEKPLGRLQRQIR